ncbi:PAS domain S-box protein [Methanospirillum sp.]|uniref:PAS domain S-box protein n=2 Tax=Methanospirillum sp. TaxID=45200 RepID=UPI002BA4F944|nr:PAS domain S-box protein [Methanospirillum sp.]HPP77678.1 PAS domain S-box protein [Methanospirillum sp.]
MSGDSLISRFTIILLVLLILSILSVTTLWYVDTKNQIESHFAIRQNNSEQILLQSVIWIDGGIRLYEYSFEPGMKEAMGRFLAAYNASGGDIQHIDLTTVKKSLNESFGGTWDLYIINDQGRVMNTTFLPDLHLDFQKYPGFHRILTHIREEGSYVIDRTVKGFVKGAPHRKFAYQGTPDRKYVLEISRNFQKFIPAEIDTSYAELLKNLPRINPDIISVELYNTQGDLVSRWSENASTGSITPESQAQVIRVLSDKKSFTEYNNTLKQVSSFLYLPIPDTRYPSTPMMNLVGRIVYTTEKIQNQILEISIIYVSTLLGTLFLAGLLVWQTSRFFSNPVKGLISDLNRIAQGDLNHQIQETGVFELRQIEDAINRLVSNLKKKIQTIQTQEEQVKAELANRIKAEENIRQLLHEVQEKERLIKESEVRYRSVVETQNEFICRFKPDGTHIFVNEAYCRFFKKRCTDILGAKFSPAIPDDERALVKNHFARLTPEHPADLNEHHIILPNGEKRYIQWIDQAIFSENGELTEYQSVGRDLTALKELEKSLHASDALYREIVNAMDDGVFVTDRSNSILIWNGWRLGRKAGLLKKRDHIEGSDLFSVLAYLSEDDRRQYDEVFSSGKIVVYETVIEKRRKIFLEMKLIPIITDDQVTTVVTLIRDMTIRKEAETALQKLNLDLEEIIRKRTEDLQASLDELDAFAYSVSHDLRGPVRTIDGFSHLLLLKSGEHLDEESRHLISKIRESTATMDTLIQDLLRFSRTARQPLQVIEIDMAGLVRGVITELTSQPESRQISVSIQDLPSSQGDPSLIRQVWYNLISNSIKFARPGTIPDITIGSYERENEIIYYIKDKGVGFDMQYADKVFEVFSRLAPSPEIEGTGVGLALVKRIILRHHGRIWVQSKAGRGTTFYFTMQGRNGTERR